MSLVTQARAIWEPHAILREGKKYKVYKDSLGFLTGGIGHLIKQPGFKLGDPLSEAQIMAWFESDTDIALHTSLRHWEEIGEKTAPFLAALISVNFQLGDFSQKFKNSYKLLVDGKYDTAIGNIKTSLWMKQTPVRANDFIQAIKEIT